MTRSGFTLMEELDSLYQRESEDPDFELIARKMSARANGELADLIEADGRVRIRLERAVTLNRYLDALPELRRDPVPLDAAIDMVLRSMARLGGVTDEAIARLVDRYPDLETPIREAATLNDIVGSTRGMQRAYRGSSVKRLPLAFGPRLSDGLPQYKLRELLGEGAFGQVYLAVDRKFSEKNHVALVAIKVLSGLERSSQARQLLVDEATKARRISHVNVAQVLERGISDEDEDFIVYEYVDGGDLERAIRPKRALEVRKAVALVAKVARGVHAAHMAGLVHCDLKPNNILLTADSEPKVADFGVAIRLDDQGAWQQAESGEREPVGNIAYMSPEQYRMEPGSLTIPTDVYALGGILYRLVTGRLPNGSTRDQIKQIHDAADGRAAPPALEEHDADVDPDLAKICHRAMAVHAADRYDSAARLADDLDAWLRRESIPWTRPSIRRRLGLWVRRAPAAALAVLVLAAVVIACFLLVLAAQAEQMRRNARRDLGEFVNLLKQAEKEGLAEGVITHIWLTEWMYGPTVLGEGPKLFELWDLREDIIRGRLAEAEARGHDGDLQTLLWETALVFWLVKDGTYEEADERLAGNYAAWEAMLAPDDDWLADVRGLQACIDVGRLVADDDREEVDVAAVQRTLEDLDVALNSRARGAPLHMLVLEHLRLLYGSDALDDGDRLEFVEARIAELRE